MKSIPPAIFLMGPTASGKTGVAVELAQTLSVEIISVDSALVYRDMEIGTAKPDAATLARAPHHLLDIRDPTEAYSAAAFRHDALRLMHDITQRGRIPLLVGGTMLYFRALQHGLSPLPEADPAIRAALDAEIALHGVRYLHRQLAEVDAETAGRLKPTDTQRIQRAMEIYRLTGKPMSILLNNSKQENPTLWERPLGRDNACRDREVAPTEVEYEARRLLPYRITSIAIAPSDRAQLHARISTRFKAMLEQGLVEELRALRQRYQLHPNLPSMRCVGYRQAWQFIEGEIDQTQLLETGIAATRQLAKRQLTWLRSMPDNIVIDCLAHNLIEQARNTIKLQLHV